MSASDHHIPDEAAMLAFGAGIAAELKGGAVLALVGPLGAGKTHFAKGVVAGLGGDADAVTSPTFTLVHEYTAACRLPVFHFDWYRMESPAEVLAIGWDEYLDEDEGVLLIEWADKFPQLPPADTRWLRFEISEQGTRRVTVSSSSSSSSSP